MNLPNKPKNFSTVETNFGTTVAKGLWVQAAQMLEYVNASYPLGMLMYFYGSQASLPAQPDSRFWKFMDGTPVSNPDSPLYGLSFPDMRGIFVRHPTSTESVGNVNGLDQINLTHNHGGSTGTTDDRNEIKTNFDFGGDNLHAVSYSHTHTLDTTSLTYNTKPISLEVQVYMRIL